jgi:autoinducer 2-degrading protein
MLVIHVFAEVKPGHVELFKQATLANARASLLEPGIVRFDILQETECPEKFVLVEVYRTKDDPARHKETRHYKIWKDIVEDLMAVPRTKKVYDNIFPTDEGWV